MKGVSALIALLLLGQVVFAQKISNQADTTSSSYGRLATMKTYNASFQWGPPYRINNKEVDKATFDHYRQPEQDIGLCKPCILTVYGLDEKIVRKAVQYTDYPVGYWIEYFPGGKVKVIGHYKENTSGDWKNAYDRGFCRRDGLWTYFDEKGRRLYTESWQDGQFIKQSPEQTKPELWAVQLLYNGQAVKKQLFSPQQFKDLSLVPKFKNSAVANTVITGKLTIHVAGYTANNYPATEQKFTPDDFSKIDVEKMLVRSKIPTGKVATGDIIIFVDGAYYGEYTIKIER